jgi:hypothetical protein
LVEFKLHRKFPWISQIYDRLDDARCERDRLSAELGRIAAELDEVTCVRDQFIAQSDRLRQALNKTIPFAGGVHQFRTVLTESESAALPPTPAVETQNPQDAGDDRTITERVMAAYRLALSNAPGPSGSFWEGAFFDLKRDVHSALLAGDAAIVGNMLRDPGSTDLFYGFENLARSLSPCGEHGVACYLDLLLLCEAIGARRLWNPEYLDTAIFPDVEELLLCIDERVGFRVTFPNPFAGEIGLTTSRGVASYRAVQSLYQAWRVSDLARRPGSRVLEIGAGLGRTAFYAQKFGITDYTIVDLPLTNVAQASFLMRTLEADSIALFGENNDQSCCIRILPPSAFFSGHDNYDLVLNVDSMTEMTLDIARSYCAAIKQRGRLFLSINHEHNQFTIHDVCAEATLPNADRHTYWMRRGYVEELFKV